MVVFRKGMNDGRRKCPSPTIPSVQTERSSHTFVGDCPNDQFYSHITKLLDPLPLHSHVTQQNVQKEHNQLSVPKSS